MTESLNNTKKNYYFVDLLTIISALGVLIVHVTHVLAGFHVINYKTFPTADIYRFDSTAVQLFFIMSAFKITLSIKDKIKNKTFSYGKYIVKRIFAIWFIYMIALIAYLIFRYHFRQAEFESLTTWDYLSHILLLNGFNPTAYNTTVASGWFIGCLMIYYLITPLLVKIFDSTSKTLTLCTIAYWIRYVFNFMADKPLFDINKSVWSTFVSQSIPMHLCFFTLGILAYFLVVEKDFSFKWYDILITSSMLIYFWYTKDTLATDSIILLFLFLMCSKINVNSEKHKVVPTLAKYTLPVYLFQMLLLRSIAMFINFGENFSDWDIWWVTLLSSTIILFVWGAILYYTVTKPTTKLYNLIFNKKQKKNKTPQTANN